jgi:hypothetical protein
MRKYYVIFIITLNLEISSLKLWKNIYFKIHLILALLLKFYHPVEF